MIEQQNFYRPEWTCGRYNAEKRAAIIYNLVEGMCYFLEDFSAAVVGEILAVKRNEQVYIETVAKNTGIAEESIEEFFAELLAMGLLTNEAPTAENIADYRRRVKESKDGEYQVEKTTQEKLPYEVSSAEMAYTEVVGGVTSVMFELTYRCSEQCIHCYNPGATRNDDEKSRRADRQELTFDDYKRIIDELHELGLVKVCLTGGDPFSKRECWQIIDYLYEKEIAFDIFTNAQALNDEKIIKLANRYPRLIGISIYSGDEAEHDKITRIKGSWQKSINAVKQLSELAVPTNLKCCVMRPNIRNYYKVAELAKQYNAVPQFEICITDSIEGDACASQNLRLPPEYMEIVLRDNNVPLYVGKEAPNFGGQAKAMDKNPCGAGENSFCITPDGSLQPCAAFPLSFGCLKEKSMVEIFKNKNLHWWLNLKLRDYENCGRLEYCAYCNLCPGNNFIAHGTPTKPSENNCSIAKMRYELAQKMMQGYEPLENKTLAENLSELDNTIQPLRQVFAHCTEKTRGKRINGVSGNTSVTAKINLQ
ncbi:MAG: radical SAM protein [Prevotellaceae bacterium]|nr:radical SAM protein [Prevotellaceae bacterium]